MSRQIGRFYLTGPFFRGHDDDWLVKLQAGLAVVHIENEMHRDRSVVFAVGEMFEPVQEGEEVPLYELDVTRTDDGNAIVKFIREH